MKLSNELLQAQRDVIAKAFTQDGVNLCIVLIDASKRRGIPEVTLRITIQDNSGNVLATVCEDVRLAGTGKLTLAELPALFNITISGR